ncbi:MAG: Dolichyl-phosphate-mannose-protein mannosyltransferase [Thermomicrobiales bacterium]|nr:Dolichyl-phosphate-mannose-protein mannosyltransferase [Thermomicrobiales bacterium]
MVAGSRTGSSGGFGAGAVCPFPAPSVQPRVRAWLRVLPRLGDWPALAAFYLVAVAALLLPWPFGAHPDWAYNWEGYTAWRWATYWEPPAGPTVDIWAPTDGLMTDSGQGPLVGLPVAIGVAVAGIGLEAMRVPVALLAACSVPLLWVLGRRVVGAGAATLAALLLAVSPVFLVYGRTATLVGVSLAPLLLSALALVRVLEAGPGEGWRSGREGLLAGAMLLGLYAYAPVRLFWPLAIGLLGWEAVRNRERRATLLRTALLCALVVPVATMALEWLAAPEPDPVAAAVGYFHARGEQLVAMSGDPGAAERYLRDGGFGGDPGWVAAGRLVGQNAADLGNLLLDRGTAPAPTDYWNERGRFWPWFFLPLATIGALALMREGRRAEARLVLVLSPLLLCAGLALPLLLTSRVHIGRLAPVLPFAVLLAAAGVWTVAGWLSGLGRWAGWAEVGRWVAPVLAGAVLLPAAVSARADMAAPLGPTRESLTAAALAVWQEEVWERGGAVLVEDPALGDDIERVHVATYRLDLDGVYRFVELGRAEVADGGDKRPALLWRGALGALEAGELVGPCERLWFVAPEVAGRFFDAWHGSGCAGAPDSVMLP